MSKKASGIVLILVLAIIGVVIFLCCTYANGFSVAQNSENMYAMNEVIQNVVENNTKIEPPVKEEINVVEEAIEEKNESVVQTEEPVVEEEVIQNNNSELESDSDEDKAIAIVKKDWGDTQGVAFKVEQINGDGSYVVSVRNDDSIALEWYTVYPKTGKFTK